VRVCLVSAPTLAEFEDLERLGDGLAKQIPLGLLALAGALEDRGVHHEVVDVDGLYASWRAASRARENLARLTVEDLAARGAQVYGFSTMCGSYPLTLRMAAALKDMRPDCRIVLGGPQATATAGETLAAFPGIDVVVRGEGEAVFPALLDAFASGRDLSSLRGITYRAAGAVVGAPDAPLIEDLDRLPLAAYHLEPDLRSLPSLPLEAGRGCPFSCTFCSTSRFFGRRFRVKSAGRIVDEMLKLRRAYGTSAFDLIHDNFTLDRRGVVAFCEAVSSCGETLTWSCSSRVDALDDELIDRMWEAGCTGIFLGVESGSATIQRSIGKRLDLQEARKRLRRIHRRRIPATVAFITGFPEETEQDLRDTVGFFVDVLRFDRMEPLLGLLSPLAGTAIHECHRAGLVRDEIVSDMAFQGSVLDPADVDLISRHPALFSSHWSVPTTALERAELWGLRAFLLHARCEMRWLLVGAAQAAGDGIEAYRSFRDWRGERERGASPSAVMAYYRGSAFRGDFIRFVAGRLAERSGGAAHSLRALASYYASIGRDTGSDVPRRAGPAAAPRLAPGVRVSRLSCDGAALLRCLRRAGDLARVPRRPSTLVTRNRAGRRQILHVSEVAADLLELCDGTREPRSLTDAFAERHPEVCGISPELACAAGVAMLRRRGLLAR
jgi:radical SAM superfamily enzyme YgiQ (UPF0313 family)